MYFNTGVYYFIVYFIQLLHSNMTNLKDVRLSQWCRWRHISWEVWCCVGGRVL